MGRSVLRVGAAAFAVGLSLAGPAPSALAEGGEQAASSAESPPASSSADVTRSERSPAQRPVRRAARSEAVPNLPKRIAQGVQTGEPLPAASRSRRGEGPGSRQAPLSAADPNASTPAPTAAVGGGQSPAPTPVSAAGLITSAPAGVDAPSPAPAGAGAPAAAVFANPAPAQPSTPVMRPLAPGRALASLPAKVVAILDKVERWLSSLPPNALTQGALLLVRRALGSAPTAGIKGVQVVLVNKTDLPITFGEGPSDDLASAKYLLRRLDPGQTTTIAHDYDRTKNSDVEVVIGTNFYQPRLIVQGSNHWDKAPTLLLRASPREDEELAPGQLYNTIYRAMYYDKGWLYDSWEPLAEGTGCHCDANNSGGPAQGGMRVYVARNRDEKDYKSFTVEIYELPAADLASNAYISTPHGLPNYYCDGNGKYGRFINGKG